jgi:transposase InsO family protein
MKEWLTAQEIADAALPDLPGDRRNVQRHAQREDWDRHPAFARNRAGRGGGLEYNIRILPSLAQLEWTRRHLPVSAELVEPAVTDAVPPAPTNRAARERDARLAIIAAFELFARGLIRLSHTAHVQLFVDRYNVGTVAVDPWIKELVPAISKRSVDRWRAARREGKPMGADRGLARKGTGVLDRANDGQVRAFVLATIAQQPHLAADQVRRQCRHRFGDQLAVGGRRIEMPPVRAFQRLIATLKDSEHVALTKLTNPDLYRSTMLPAGVGTHRHITEPNALWMIDASPADALCVDARHSIYGVVDIATRRTIWHVSRTPRASAVALLVRKAILAWGVPDLIKSDNGSDFVARDTKRLFGALGIEVELSDPYSPQQKGHIERAIRTFQHDCATLLPGYIGHSVSDRKAIESRKSFAARLGEKEAETFGVSLTGAKLQEHIDQWAELIYERAPHAGLGGKSPFEAAAASTAPVRTVDERALDLLLMPVAGKDGRRRVTKFGIRIDGHYYVTPSILPGADVFVRQDPNDLGRAFVFAADAAEFLGEALCAELRGLHPATLLKVTRETQAQLLDDATRGVRAQMRELAKGPSLIEKALQVAARDAGNVIMMPKREELHETPEIVAASRAAGAPAPEHNPAVELFQARLLEEDAGAAVVASNVRPLRAEETMHQRYARAVELRLFLDRGGVLAPAELLWLGGYEAGSEFRTMKTIHDDLEEQSGS